MTVSQVAKQLNISADTIRHYVRSGLLQPKRDPHNGYQRFTQHTIKQLQFILQAKSLGFSLNDIAGIMQRTSTGQSLPASKRDDGHPLAETKAKLEAMQTTYHKMQQAMQQWQDQDDCTPTGEHICHLIEGISDEVNQHD